MEWEQLNPSNAQAYSELGQAYTFAGDLEKGVAALEEALAINPQGDSAWSTQSALGFAYFMMDDLDAAIAVTRKSAVINPNLVLPQAFLAGFLALKGEREEAASLRQRVLDTAPEFDARKVTRGFEVVSPELCRRFDEALREAGFELN